MNKKNPIKKLLKDIKRKRNSSAERAEDILRLIRSREKGKRDIYTVPIWEEKVGLWRHGRTQPITNRPMTADTWQRFKRDFIAKYDGELVKETGFTDSEFLEWFKTGKRELHKEPSKLEELLAELHAHEDATKGDDDEEK
jgi:hypothetical protein